MYAGEADALVQKANLTGCARMDTVQIMQKGHLNFLYPKGVPGGQSGIAAQLLVSSG